MPNPTYTFTTSTEPRAPCPWCDSPVPLVAAACPFHCPGAGVIERGVEEHIERAYLAPTRPGKSGRKVGVYSSEQRDKSGREG